MKNSNGWDSSKAVEGAIRFIASSRYGFGTGESYINTNRDQLFGGWFLDAGTELCWFSDKTLAVMKWEDYEGNLIAAFLNYCCHGTCAFTRRDVDGKIKTSPEFMGYACNYVQERYGGTPVIIWSSGGSRGSESVVFPLRDFREHMRRMDILRV